MKLPNGGKPDKGRTYGQQNRIGFFLQVNHAGALRELVVEHMLSRCPVEAHHRNCHHIHFVGMGLQKFICLFTGIAGKLVIRIHEIYILAPGKLQPPVSGRGYAAIFLVDYKKIVRIPGRIGVTDGSTVIRGTIIHKNQLNPVDTDALGNYTFNGLFQIQFHIVYRHNQCKDIRIFLLHLQHLRG